MPKEKNPVNVGDVFTRLTVLEKLIKNERTHCKCLCSCGKITITQAKKLKNGHTKSCGCFKLDMAKQANTKHGMKGSKIYGVWNAMKNRCYNTKVTQYPNYGGRGIKVCEKWQNFEGFYDDMGKDYKQGLTLDRIDTNKNYCKSNCKWSTPKEQANNTRKSVVWFYEGKWISSNELAKILGITKTSLYENKYLKNYPKKKLYEE